MSVDKLLARSTPLSVNSYAIQELTDIPGVGWDITKSLMDIREEGQITLPVLGAVTRKVFQHQHLGARGLFSVNRGSAPRKVKSDKRPDLRADEDL